MVSWGELHRFYVQVARDTSKIESESLQVHSQRPAAPWESIYGSDLIREGSQKHLSSETLVSRPIQN